MRRRPVYSFFAVALAVVMLTATVSFACGPFAMEAVFTFTVHPPFPLDRFARGEIGVVQPSYARSYLYVAYRQLNGFGFTAREQKAINELWKERLDLNGDLGAQNAVQVWLTARKKVPGVAEPPKIDEYRNREKPNEYESYLNCQKDAFENAATTLDSRIAKYGVDSPAMKDWVEAQDQVFANCSAGQHIPADAPSTADALFRADRTYQIAAANFYAGNFEPAKKLFESIAVDTDSPWQRIAAYLIARTFLRKASLGATETRTASLTAAENQLHRILTDRKLNDLHPSATRLLDVVRIRLHPEERLHELSRVLLVKNQNDALKQSLWDYTLLLDAFLGGGESELKTKPGDEIRIDDLTDWIASVELTAAAEVDHALAKWDSTHTPAWLIASLAKVNGKHPKAAELIAQGMNIKPDSPAFPSARFHVVRLLLESGKVDDARALLDDLLKTRSQFDASSLNLLISQRMFLANSLAEFLTYAPRLPAGFSWNEDGREIPADASEVSEQIKDLKGKLLFDDDAARVLNQQLPVVVLGAAAKSTILPAHLRRDLLQAAWLRAVLLGDNTTADELAPTVKAAIPELSPFLADFLTQTQPDAKQFSAIYAWLKFPGLEPVVDSGIGREPALGEQDIYRDNWWCRAASSKVPDGTSEEDKNKPQPLTTNSNGRSAFLTEAQRSTAAREQATLNALGAAPNFLCRQVIQWVTKNPADPRAPEALHRAVNTTRHGCTDKETGRWSKAAYDLLHRKYPNTTWAKKTKYWFKD